MSATIAREDDIAAQRVILTLLPLMEAVFVAFLVIGAALPVLPLHVHQGLGFGTFTVGLVAGAQFAAALISRLWSGGYADRRGARLAVLTGLAGASAAGLFYVVSLRFAETPFVSVAFLLAGRAVLGAAESFIITGATIWGLARVGAPNAGKVIAWMGTAMFAGFAAGAPIGTVLYQAGGFGAVASLTLVAPLITTGLIMPLHGAQPAPRSGPGVFSVIGKIWLPGLGAALSSIGFGVIAAFGSLLFAGQNWTPVWLPFTAYAVSLIVARIALGHLPDRIGGARVAILFAVIETAGLAVIWLAGSAMTAAAGAALTGLGYSLVFPALGVEAVRRAPPESRGVAMGAYTACLDLALGVAVPALGALGGTSGLGLIFLVSALAALGAAGIAAMLQRSTFGVFLTPGVTANAINGAQRT
jgi:MFS family permease